MTSWFADSFYFIALLVDSDAAHEKALGFRQQLAKRGLVTTTWILTEVADALHAPHARESVVALVDFLNRDQRVEIVPANQLTYQRGFGLYRARPDKDWSLTDCISFVVMEDCGLTEALTGDKHFEQAGFIPLMR